MCDLTACLKIAENIGNDRQRIRRPILKALRMARADAGLTISELAERAGVSRDTISNAEKGRHGLQYSTLHKIARALGKAPSALLAEEERLAPKVESRSSLEPSFEDALEGERREAIYDVVLNAARRQAEQDRKAANRTFASEGIPQPAYFKDHENAAVHRLLEYPTDELAGAILELAQRVHQLEEFPAEQVAAYLAQNERDEEFIRRELGKMSEKDFREALLASPALRRIREYYRAADTEANATPQSESA